MITKVDILTAMLIQPNNANKLFIEYLSNRDDGYVVKEKNRRICYYVKDNKKYAITLTGHNKKYILCRQYNKNKYDGIISLHQKTGDIHIIDDVIVSPSYNRVYDGDVYYTARSKNKMQTNNKQPKIYDEIENNIINYYIKKLEEIRG